MRCLALILALAGVPLVLAACDQPDTRSDTRASQAAGKQHAQAGSGEEHLLLLDDNPEGSQAPAGPVADNSRCHVCHLNYAREELALDHARADIGCADCHGESDEHIADESWASGGNGTPPERMYPPETINPACLSCHPRDTVNKALHEAFFAGKTPQKVCTDCHGAHRLAKRQCKWK